MSSQKLKILIGFLPLLLIIGGLTYWLGISSLKLTPSPTPTPETTVLSEIAPEEEPATSPTPTSTPTPTPSPTATATATPSPTPSATPASLRAMPRAVGYLPTTNFTASYQTRFTCSSFQALSFKIVNTGDLNLESWQAKVEAPPGTIRRETIASNDLFRHTTTNCSTPTYPNIVTDETAWVYVTIPSFPPAGANWKATFKICSQDGMAGSCKEVVLNFTL